MLKQKNFKECKFLQKKIYKIHIIKNNYYKQILSSFKMIFNNKININNIIKIVNKIYKIIIYKIVFFKINNKIYNKEIINKIVFKNNNINKKLFNNKAIINNLIINKNIMIIILMM